jgi:hypothetical protein
MHAGRPTSNDMGIRDRIPAPARSIRAMLPAPGGSAGRGSHNSPRPTVTFGRVHENASPLAHPVHTSAPPSPPTSRHTVSPLTVSVPPAGSAQAVMMMTAAAAARSGCRSRCRQEGVAPRHMLTGNACLCAAASGGREKCQRVSDELLA